ncbi:hypothetical protein NPIL_656581 [Nephila pilipes]|uniref:Uncharacterized protein n=1 Tax=Nephila pilipes TaxID=299642 RepID=A0A8X6MPJ4_NEPPI|nr:hypothetical protein NPIL_656581 [Nephila pilipes]
MGDAREDQDSRESSLFLTADSGHNEQNLRELKQRVTQVYRCNDTKELLLAGSRRKRHRWYLNEYSIQGNSLVDKFNRVAQDVREFGPKAEIVLQHSVKRVSDSAQDFFSHAADKFLQ